MNFVAAVGRPGGVKHVPEMSQTERIVNRRRVNMSDDSDASCRLGEKSSVHILLANCDVSGAPEYLPC